MSSLRNALAFGHFPLHEGYVLLGWFVGHLIQLLHLPPLTFVIISQIFLAYATLICFYHVVSTLTNVKTAWFAVLIASCVPIFWITNVTIMMETVYLFFFFLSMYLIQRFTKSNNTVFLHLSVVSLTLAILTHVLIMLWIPFLLFFIFLTKKTIVFRYILYLLGYYLIFAVCNVLLVSIGRHNTPLQVIFYLYLSKSGEFAAIPQTIFGILIFFRNAIIPLMRDMTSVLVLSGIVGILVLFKTNKKLFWLSLLWVLPSFIANQWWDSLLQGRHALIAGFGLAFVSAYVLQRKHILFSLLMIYIVVVSSHALLLLKADVPYLIEANAIAKLPQNSLILESHFARPQAQQITKGTLFPVNEPGWGREKAEEMIDAWLREKRPIFITEAALSEPYGLYSGPYVHVLSLSYAKPFELSTVMTKYIVKPYKTISEKDNLRIYKIVGFGKSTYPDILSLKNSYRRIDYYDFLGRIIPL